MSGGSKEVPINNFWPKCKISLSPLVQEGERENFELELSVNSFDEPYTTLGKIPFQVILCSGGHPWFFFSRPSTLRRAVQLVWPEMAAVAHGWTSSLVKRRWQPCSWRIPRDHPSPSTPDRHSRGS